MSVELDEIKAIVAFYEEVGPLQEELEAAREVKAKDPVRFAEAKQAFEAERTKYRLVAEYVNASAEDGSATITTAKVSAKSKAIPVAGGDK